MWIKSNPGLNCDGHDFYLFSPGLYLVLTDSWSEESEMVRCHPDTHTQQYFSFSFSMKSFNTAAASPTRFSEYPVLLLMLH